MPSSPTQPMSPVASAAATIKPKQVQMQEVGVRPPTGTTNAGGTKTMPRAPPASTHRQSHSLRQRPKVLRGWSNMFGGGEHGEEGRNIPDGPRTANAKHQHHVNALSHSRPLTHAPTQLDSANPPFLPSSHNSPSPRTHDRLSTQRNPANLPLCLSLHFLPLAPAYIPVLTQPLRLPLTSRTAARPRHVPTPNPTQLSHLTLKTATTDYQQPTTNPRRPLLFPVEGDAIERPQGLKSLARLRRQQLCDQMCTALA
ncbi:serine/threonine-protein kinase KIN2 [Pleurotus ostreatus]|uniref:Uncharacterized protein n=2 Tax=Pleurotus ostreatus TaxID=5322 RepID=A0A067NX27_PLEO1|nr:serine/threonine-protein kinase KIN2 [Pleurotus ostreatus]XP_036630020.1 serine/threonine-protein kinase KIN2 [Pleurotus ostreatus]KDQ32386.1 hypothetical protein PLEOSDRAFT_1100870 [Pleurotus ostreatus PC15]KAF7426680.1 serine/threonine-protein kinase KIN2 [Pleurotus ostreatus]KAF7426716.1 serine/threonine-protein kinase KIN2 [Pleurotus ostreatus]KAJ8694321.1 Serine/threonine-protein kinase [Pleurotus ostreatus]KDQ32449.1 hypothetical protein PLEOSDRAFT_1111153 [Pleurotus ostreatus PC15]